jgi:hypothetical protein
MQLTNSSTEYYVMAQILSLPLLELITLLSYIASYATTFPMLLTAPGVYRATWIDFRTMNDSHAIFIIHD